MPGLSSVAARPLVHGPRLRVNESSSSVIVIEWGESPTDIDQPILYEVDYILTPFGGSAMAPKKEFVSCMYNALLSIKLVLLDRGKNVR